MNDLHPVPNAPDFTGMEAALRDACTRARHAVFPLAVMLRLYRSVATLARALMIARVDIGLARGLSDDLILLLDAARDAAGSHFPDPEMPVMDAIRIHRAVATLAGIAHRARAGRPVVVEMSVSGDHVLEVAVAMDTQPVTPPTEPPEFHSEPDNPLSAWRNDHKVERDQRAHELLRTVIDDRLIAKIRAMNKRDRDERDAGASAVAA